MTDRTRLPLYARRDALAASLAPGGAAAEQAPEVALAPAGGGQGALAVPRGVLGVLQPKRVLPRVRGVGVRAGVAGGGPLGAEKGGA